MITPIDERVTTNNKKEKGTVLIVDGAPSGLSLLLDYLRGSGFKVLVAKDSESALLQAAYAKPDIILLEAMMPDIDGFEICHHLKANKETKDIPVIFITSLSHTIDKMKGFKLGAVDYITKPLQCEEVLAHITTHLSTHNFHKRLQEQNRALQEENLRRSRVQEFLRESRERYRLLTEKSTDMISRQTIDGVYRFVSPACHTLLGYEVEEMIGRSAYEFFHPEDLRAIQEADKVIQDRPSTSTITYRVRRKDDSYIWLETTSRMIADPNTDMGLEIIAVSRDVTERKRAEVILQQAHDELEQRIAERMADLAEANTILQKEITERKRAEAEIQAYSEELKAKNEALSRLDKMKNEFLATTSHELRTPLNGIIGIAESMLDGATGELTPEQMHNLTMVVFSGRRLINLVNDTLDFSKLKHREMDLELKAVDLHSMAEVVLTLSQPLDEQKSLQLINRIDSDLPAVKADENRVQQILYNLVGNAVKFTQTGNVTVSAAVEGDDMVVTVSDTGVGIPPDKLDTIFESFEQIEGSDTRGHSGTGLGLSITKRLVELHGGTIRAESVLGEGSHFTFTLPLHKWPVSASALNRAIDALSRDFDSSVVTDLQPQVEPVLVTTPQQLGANEEFTILVVDDDLINVQVLTNYLSMQNYGVVQAFDGFEALEAMDEVKPDLVLLDLMMPRMSGYEVCQKIRERYPTHQLPIVLLTAKTQASDIVAGFEAGANDYLIKPFDKNELLARVKIHLRLAKVNTAYGRFVPYEFLEFLDKESIEDVKLGDQVQREMTILFSDIRSFTTLSEAMTPQESFNFLNSYLGRVSPIIRQHNGFIDKYIGDAVMALFPENVEDALQAAIDIQREVSRYNEYRQEQGWMPVRVGIGIHTGKLMLGTIGEEMRMESTVISDAVNLAFRMEGLTKLYGSSIVISERSLFGLVDPAKYHFRYLDRVQVKGKKEPISVFEVLDGDAPELIDLKLKLQGEFEKGLVHYHKRQFAQAKICFKRVLTQNLHDKAAHFYLRRVTHFMEYGTPPDWEGIEVLT